MISGTQSLEGRAVVSEVSKLHLCKWDRESCLSSTGGIIDTAYSFASGCFVLWLLLLLLCYYNVFVMEPGNVTGGFNRCIALVTYRTANHVLLAVGVFAVGINHSVRL